MLRECRGVGLHAVDVAIICRLHPFCALLSDGVLGVPLWGLRSLTPCGYLLYVHRNHIYGGSLTPGIIGTLISGMARLVTIKTGD